MSTSCYNLSGNDYNAGGLSMQPGRQGTEFPENLFNTWLKYRDSKGQSRAEIIREVNATLKRKYDNNIFYKWKKQKISVPDSILKEFVIPELPTILEWFYKTKGYPSKDINFQKLANAVRPAIKKDFPTKSADKNTD